MVLVDDAETCGYYTQRLMEGEMVSVGDAETGGYTETMEGEMVLVGDAETGGYTDRLMEGEMVSVGDAETGGYRDLWREKWCQWVTPRLVATETYGAVSYTHLTLPTRSTV